MTGLGILVELHLLGAVIAAVHVILNKREPVGAVLWLFMVATLPGLGLLLYLVFGVSFYDRRASRMVKAKFRFRQELAQEAWRSRLGTLRAVDERYRVLSRCHDLLDRLGQRPPVGENHVDLLVGGANTYRALFAELKKAADHIHIEVYILAGDEFGRDLLAILAEKARAGVEVRVLYDAIGSIGIPGRFLADMERAGIRVEEFGRLNPIRRGFQINFRNHRKNIIIDGKVGFTGGINLHAENSRRYCRQPRDRYERLIRDYHFRVTGPVVNQLQEVFAEDWHYASGELLTEDRYFPPAAPASDAGPGQGKRAVARVLTSGPGDDAEVISKALFAAISSARQEILIVSPYFYPVPSVLEALACASQAGIAVHIIVPAASDHQVVTWAGQSLFPYLLAHGVQVHLRRLPFIHSKAVLIDRAWALIGSTNLDYRSLRLNFELNLEIVDTELVAELGQTLEGEMRESALVTESMLARQGTLARFRNNFCALFAPIL